jgi:hypothetical protein
VSKDESVINTGIQRCLDCRKVGSPTIIDIEWMRETFPESGVGDWMWVCKDCTRYRITVGNRVVNVMYGLNPATKVVRLALGLCLRSLNIKLQ